MSTWLTEPAVEIARDEGGAIDGVMIRLRTGNAHSTSRASGDTLALFFWDRDGLPVGIQLLEPVDDAGLFALVAELGGAEDGPRPGLAFARLHQILHGLRRGVAELSAA